MKSQVGHFKLISDKVSLKMRLHCVNIGHYHPNIYYFCAQIMFLAHNLLFLTIFVKVALIQFQNFQTS
jgi:hypothetical protein